MATSALAYSTKHVDFRIIHLPPDFEFKGDGEKHKENWEKGDKIGAGGFSVVYKAKVFFENKVMEMAVKRVKTNKEKNQKAVKTELIALKKLSHERIVNFYGFSDQGFEIFIFMEYLHRGSLRCLIREKGCLSEDLVRYFTRQLLEGIEYLHKLRVIHRDIKSDNILMSDERSVKLADFGLCKFFDSLSKASTTEVGTYRYMAPERFSGDYSYAVDIWSLGCVVQEMLTGQYPFHDWEPPKIHTTLTGRNPSPLTHVKQKLSPSAEQFLSKIFQMNPDDRPSATALIQDSHYIPAENSFIMELTHENVNLKEELDQCKSKIASLEKEISSMKDSQGCGPFNSHGTENSIKLNKTKFKLITEQDLKKALEETPTEANSNATDTTAASVDYNDESPLMNHFKNCKTYLNHHKFIPVKKFVMENLPEGYRKTDLYKVITLICDLTVQLKVNMVTSKRPDINFKKNVPNSHSIKGDENIMRQGTGMICGIEKFSNGRRSNETTNKKLEKCLCEKCNYSSSPKTTCWEIIVQTSLQLISDKSQATSSTCMLFDNGQASFLSCFDMGNVNSDMNLCRIKCVTCDENLANKLEESLQVLNSQLKIVNVRYQHSKDRDKLAIIVAHPHEDQKQVSIGNWQEKKEVLSGDKKRFFKFTYTTAACEGSIGAFVYCLGYSSLKWWESIVHSGSYDAELNCNGAML